MGCVVLNEFTRSNHYQNFESSFNQGDGIFIINSIFGGTGAAGYPLLLKNIRNSKQPQVNTAIAGAITYLPYFDLNQNDVINSNTFLEKSKAALEYYNRTILSTNQIDTQYFIGNTGANNTYNAAPGGKSQTNPANFLEMAGALAIFDYCQNFNGLARNNPTAVKEFGINKNTDNISFSTLNNSNKQLIKGKLTRYKLFSNYLDNGLHKAMGVSRWTKSNINLVPKSKQSSLDSNYFDGGPFQNEIKVFNNHFKDFLGEMRNSNPSFDPFLPTEWDDALKLVRNKKPKGNASFKSLDIENCKNIDRLAFRGNNGKIHTTLIKLFSHTTDKVLTKTQVIL